MDASLDKLYQSFQDHPDICIDSRKVTKGCLFFAFKGSSFDGNAFAQDAIDRGAKFAIIDDPDYKTGAQFILVNDVLNTLKDLARIHRTRLKATFIGITGTNGKTTTKELISRVLSTKYSTHSTQGNLNNHIGVPLTILSCGSSSEMVVVEMGANHLGEIEELCEIARPDFGLITNIGKAHLEGFGNFERIIEAKSELFRFIKSHNGKAFVNIDNVLLVRLSNQIERITYGSSRKCSLRGRIINNLPYLKIKWKSEGPWETLNTKIFGDYNFENVIAALCVGNYFGIKPDEMRNVIENYTPDNNRSQLIKTAHNQIILDAYNANPTSMTAALKNFGALDQPNKLAILGDMLELGKETKNEHLQIIKLLEAFGIHDIVLIGPVFSRIGASLECRSFIDVVTARHWFQSSPVKNYTILIKGSRGMHLEELVDVF